MRSWPVIAAAAALFGLLITGVAIIAAITGSDGCEPGGASSGPPSEQAERDIPADFLRLYQQAGAKYRIPWEILAGIGREECDHGRLDNPACTPQPGASGPGTPNFAGASGPMQIGIGGAAGNIWAVRKTDGGGDGKTGAHDPADAIATAAIILIRDKGAPQGKPIEAYRTAARAYNGAGPVAEAYADRVIADARLYSSGVNAIDDAAACAPEDDLDISFDGPPGKATLAPGADRAGATTKPIVLRYVGAMSGLIGRPIVITTGTNHSQFTTSGSVSDHWTGYAADIGMAANGDRDDGPIGDRIMTACLILAGVPRERAVTQARGGGLFTLTYRGLRLQCIWKTYAGGNHHNHVHVGVRPGA